MTTIEKSTVTDQPSSKFHSPPSLTSHDGEQRRIGVEIEYAGLSALETAQEVQKRFGGEIVQHDAHRFRIEGTELGDFKAELDTKYAHFDASEEEEGALVSRLREQFAAAVGSVSSVVVPCEIVCPPIPLEQLHTLEALVESLQRAGARGTRESIFFAFGTHLNPEIASKETRHLVSVLKAYVLMSDWLRAELDIDRTRQVMSYTDPFPEAYVRKIIAPDYWPDETQMIADYLVHNPTRNRELDMLPVFAWLNKQQVARTITDGRVGARPAFHYRLPNASLDASSNPLILEWNRWCAVEHLAADTKKLTDMADAYLQNRIPGSPAWAAMCAEWIDA